MDKTAEVRELVQEILGTLPKPYGEDIIEDVFVAIEQNPTWRQRYDEQCDELRDWVVNNWIGKYTKQLTLMDNIRVVSTTRAKIINRYTKLKH